MTKRTFYPFLGVYDLNRGFSCRQPYEPLISCWQDCKEAAETLGYSGDKVAHLEYKAGWWDGSRPQGCFQSDGVRFHFNPWAGGKARGNDHILCIRKELGK